ncbi:MAG: hypothetical protein ACRD5L_03020 [Bryobacteraceae bacterium]
MPNTFVIDGLRVKLAEINATIRDTEHRLKCLGGDRATIQAALRLFDDVGTEAPQLGIPRGSFNRTILDCLRRSDSALSARGIAETLAGDKPLAKRQMLLLTARVRNALPRLSEHLDGEKREDATYWRVKA